MTKEGYMNPTRIADLAFIFGLHEKAIHKMFRARNIEAKRFGKKVVFLKVSVEDLY